MDSSVVAHIGNDFLYTALLLALPALIVSLVVGLIVALFQTITSLQEQTLSFAPRLIAVGIALSFSLTWMLEIAVWFTSRMFLGSVDLIR